jgi:uncharacterized protein
MTSEWIIKVSKFCNLRCDYCYEFPELGNRARMSREEAAAMFDHMAAYYADKPGCEIHCIWHGGEPLLQEPEYFRTLFAEQKRALVGSGIKVRNFLQSNLTILDDERIAFLRDDIGTVGVSLDLFGEHRLTLAGKSSVPRVLKNLDRLQRERIPFGCITVLTRRTLPHLESIVRFYEKLNLSFRVLPLFRGATDDQTNAYEVNAHEVLDALCRLFDLWLASPTPIAIAPIHDQMSQLLGRRNGKEPAYYNRREHEELVVVNTNGDLYAEADAYIPGKSWGNIFRAPLAELLDGEARERSVQACERRLAAVCSRCEYFGACPGVAIAEDTRLYDDTVDAAGNKQCIVERGLFAHIERRLDEAIAEHRFDEAFLQRLSSAAPAPAMTV